MFNSDDAADEAVEDFYNSHVDCDRDSFYSEMVEMNEKLFFSIKTAKAEQVEQAEQASQVDKLEAHITELKEFILSTVDA